MKSVWHSWFWNLVTMIGMSVMAAGMLAGAVSQLSLPVGSTGRVPVAVGFGLAAGVFAVGAARAVLLGVWARQLVELNALGGYGFFRSGPTLEERAAEGLKKHLARWRKEHPAGR